MEKNGQVWYKGDLCNNSLRRETHTIIIRKS